MTTSTSVQEAEMKAVTDGAQKQFLVKAIVGAITIFVVGGVIGGVIGYSIGDSNSKSSDSSNSSISGAGSSSNDGCTPAPTTMPTPVPTADMLVEVDVEIDDTLDEITYPQYDYFLDNVDYSLYGRWETVFAGGKSPVNGSNIGMQAIHTVVLPNNKVLMVNGGSNRGFLSWDKWYEIDWDMADTYYKLVDNNGLYDVAKNEFHRIPHPLINLGYPEWEHEWFYPNDLFCSGQNHVRDGNVFFTGGTEWYGVSFTGPKTTYIYNWTYGDRVDWNEFDWTINPNSTDFTREITENLWLFSGWMKEGRWYPRTVELNDGRMVVVSGITDFNVLSFPSEISKYIELFDYDTWLHYYKQGNFTLIDDYDDPPQWKSLNMRDMPYSPLNTPLDNYPSSDWVEWVCEWTDNSSYNPHECQSLPYGVTVDKPKEFLPPGAVNVSTFAHTCEALKNDSIRLYPQMYLLEDGERILITGGGSLWWLTNCYNGSSGAPRQTNNSYIFKISGTMEDPVIEFESEQPQHWYNVTRYSTSTVDPNNSSRILNFGGHRMHTYGGAIPGWVSASEYTYVTESFATVWGGSGRGTRFMEIYNLPSDKNDIGNWEEPIEDYLGVSWDKDRLMHFSTLLPTKEILIIGGTNYKYYGAVRSPLLMTPKYDSNGVFTGKYKRRFMTDCRWQRSYHSVAVLLQDGRVLTAGGNSAPNGIINSSLPLSYNETHMNDTNTTRQARPAEFVDRFGYLSPEGFRSGYSQVPGELYQIEIFSPPYLFIDGNRRPEITDLVWRGHIPSYITNTSVNYYENDYYLMHSLTYYTLYVDVDELPSTCDILNSSVVLIKLSSSSHGWDAGQRLFDLAIINATEDSLMFETPNATDYNIVPAFYHLFFVDCRGKPSVAKSVRFDDQATHPLW